ncbi:MAG: lipopolysaccharide heptosyltransferase II [Gammaproteobacteria bacterium]|nr:lipopolysaccharide heptosyltransferase II [Gammaproteobacteria bacterium]
MTDARSDSLPVEQLLIVGPAWVGDMVMAQSLFKALKSADAGRHLDVLAPDWSVPLLARMPEVRTAVTTPFAHGRLQLRERWRLARELKSRGYQQAIILPNSFKSALIPWFAGIPRRTGYVGEQRWGLVNDIRRLDTHALPMTVQRFVALAAARNHPPPTRTGIVPPALRVDTARAARACAAFGLGAAGRPVLALCPGAEYGPAKRWPADYFAQVARAKRVAGWRVWLFGSTRDAAICAAVRARAGTECINLAGRTSLEQAIDLLSMATLVVSNDSGLMHIAAALNRPLVAVYGSSDPGFTPPLSARARVIWLGLECSPCFQRNCPLKHLNCLNQLAPEEVLQVADSVI